MSSHRPDNPASPQTAPASAAPARKIRITDIARLHAAKERIAVLTAYDAITAAWADAAGADIILVGDSLGNTALGFERTIDVTLEMMLHHAAAVSRGSHRALRVGDLPFMSYKASPEQALLASAAMIQRGHMEAVKIEGGAEVADTAARIVSAGIPVMGHIGLLPQSEHAQGGFHIQGKAREAARRLEADARALEKAGVFAIVLECLPPALAVKITQSLKIPTIGIGSGPSCSGQVLVMADVLGMSSGPAPNFAKAFANLREHAAQGLSDYISSVRSGKFPESNKEPIA